MQGKVADSFWRTIIDTMQEGMMVVSPEGRITFINNAFERLLGYTPGRIKG